MKISNSQEAQPNVFHLFTRISKFDNTLAGLGRQAYSYVARGREKQANFVESNLEMFITQIFFAQRNPFLKHICK